MLLALRHARAVIARTIETTEFWVILLSSQDAAAQQGKTKQTWFQRRFSIVFGARGQSKFA
jgi:hypothetical protein